MFFDLCGIYSKNEEINDHVEYIECLDIKNAEYETIKRYIASINGEINRDKILRYIIEQKKDFETFAVRYTYIKVVSSIFFGDTNTAIEKLLKSKIVSIKNDYPITYKNSLSVEENVFFCSSKILLIKPSVKYMQNLKILQLCCNAITHLPDEITELQNLRKLSVPRNQIFYLPKNIGNMSYLKDLVLSYNYISELPSSFAALRRLNFLSIYSNKFNNFPLEIIGCLSLQHLHFGNNQINKLPAELLTMPYLRIIEYEESKVSSVPNAIRTPNIHCSLQEIAARHVIKNALDIPLDTTKNTKKYLRSVQECFYCGGPFFDFYFEVYKEKIHENKRMLVYLKMCSKHVSNINDLDVVRFLSYPQTYPSMLIAKKYPRIRELFVISCYSLDKLKQIIEYRNNKKMRCTIFYSS